MYSKKDFSLSCAVDGGKTTSHSTVIFLVYTIRILFIVKFAIGKMG